MKSRKVAVPIDVEEAKPEPVEVKAEPVAETSQAQQSERPSEEKPVQEKSTVEEKKEPEPEVPKPKAKRAMTEAKREALRKANEARARKRKERLEGKEVKQQESSDDSKLEQKILEILKKQKPAPPAKPPRDAIRRTPAVKHRAPPRMPAQSVQRQVSFDESEEEESESEEEYERAPVRQVQQYRDPMRERHSRMYAMIFRH